MSSPAEPLPAARAIVVGHGNFADGMRSAVGLITGKGEALLPVSGRDLSLAQIEQEIRARLTSSGVSVIFTDLHAGSATMAARRVLRDFPSVILVAGANLPMLLDFVMSPEPSAADAARHAADRGRAAICVFGGAE